MSWDLSARKYHSVSSWCQWHDMDNLGLTLATLLWHTTGHWTGKTRCNLLLYYTHIFVHLCACVCVCVAKLAHVPTNHIPVRQHLCVIANLFANDFPVLKSYLNKGRSYTDKPTSFTLFGQCQNCCYPSDVRNRDINRYYIMVACWSTIFICTHQHHMSAMASQITSHLTVWSKF